MTVSRTSPSLRGAPREAATTPKPAAPGRSLEARARALIHRASVGQGARFYAAVDDGDEAALAPLLRKAARGDLDLYAAAMVQLFGGTREDHLPSAAAAPPER